MHLKLTINGEQFETLCEPRELLILVLRERFNITGPHIGCETSHCGGLHGRSRRQVRQGLHASSPPRRRGRPSPLSRGWPAPEGMHVLQEMFREHHGLQCGYCTPGMITRAWRLLQENPDPTEEEVRFGMAGNLCRCTGYQNIIKAILAAAAVMKRARRGSR